MKRFAPLPAAIFAGVLVLYLASLPVAAPASGDAARESRIAELHPLLRPHHLLLSHTFHFIQGTWRALGYSGPGFIPLEVANAVLGAGAVALFAALLGNLGATPGARVLAALLMAFSYGHWLHSREAETAMPAQLLAVTALFALARRARPQRAAGGALAGLATLYAANTVLIAPALAVLAASSAERGRRWRALAAFGIPFAALTLLPYALAAWSALGTVAPRPVLDWLSHHPSEATLAESRQITPANVLRSLSGMVNGLTGNTAVTTAAKQLLRGRAPIGVTAADWLRFVLGAAIVALAVARFALVARRRSRPDLVLAAGAAFLAVGAFNVFWFGSDPQFWLPALPFILVHWALAESLPPSRGIARRLLVRPAATAACALILLASNIAYPVPTLLQPAGGRDWRLARAFAPMARPEDMLLSSGGWGGYVREWSDCALVNLGAIRGTGDTYRRNLDATIGATLARGGTVYALQVFEVTTARAAGAWEEVELLSRLSRDDVLAALRARYPAEPVHPEVFGRTLWRIAGAGGS